MTEDPIWGPRRKLKDLDPTRWTLLHGPAGFDYLMRAYGASILDAVRALLASGRFSPLERAHADEVFSDFYTRLFTTDWLHTRAARGRGKFRNFLYGRILLFLRERRKAELYRAGAAPLSLDADDAKEPEANDVLLAAWDAQWESRMQEICLSRVESTDADAGRLLRLRQMLPDEPLSEIAKQFGWSESRAKEVRARARSLFRDALSEEARRIELVGTIRDPKVTDMPTGTE
jgi:hypothetical protein